jgi:hypothetical protein
MMPLLYLSKLKKSEAKVSFDPYLFIVVEEVFNVVIKKISKFGEIKGVTFIGGTIQQIIWQCDIILT